MLQSSLRYEQPWHETPQKYDCSEVISSACSAYHFDVAIVVSSRGARKYLVAICMDLDCCWILAFLRENAVRRIMIVVHKRTGKTMKPPSVFWNGIRCSSSRCVVNKS